MTLRYDLTGDHCDQKLTNSLVVEISQQKYIKWTKIKKVIDEHYWSAEVQIVKKKCVPCNRWNEHYRGLATTLGLRLASTDHTDVQYCWLQQHIVYKKGQNGYIKSRKSYQTYLHLFYWPRNAVKRSICYAKVCPSVCLSQFCQASTVRDIEICFAVAQYDRGMFLFLKANF